MIREEREMAIAYIKSYRKLDEDLHNIAPKDSISYHATDKCLQYWDMAIKALEQESVLDKIRTEIERLHYHPKLDFIKNDDVVDMTLDIIDKYRAEQGG